MDEFEDEMFEDFDEEDEPEQKSSGFCGLISAVMKRPEKKLFPSMDNMLNE